MSDVRAAFDVCGALPTGTTVLEASAGTGKTFTIAALATRYVAEGHAELSELMLVTFGRAATQELRTRVRERLVATEATLADPPAARKDGDDLVRHLAAAPDDEVQARRARLARALSDFDAATIATTHGFCQQMLARLGVSGDSEPDAGFLEDITDLVDEVVDDLYLRRFAEQGSPMPAMSAKCARSVAHRAVGDRQARLAPDDADAGTEAAERYEFAQQVRSEVDRRKRARRLLDYDDLLTRLRDALADPETGQAACERVRSRYRVVMVDEFQDTDPVQWDVLRLAFHGSTTLVLIGDPKQAIYAFRGADVVTYLAAADLAEHSATLARNWRSDAGLISALDVVFRGAALGDPRILVRSVDAEHRERRLHEVPSRAPLRIRVGTSAQLGVTKKNATPRVGEVRPFVAADVAADIVRLLESDATVTTSGSSERIRPGDIAVLVRTNDQAGQVRDALRALAVPVVLSATTSVFETPVAREWLVLLRALEQPHRAGRVRAAALTCFLGWDAQRLALAGDFALDDLGPRLRGWAEVLSRGGVAALGEVLTSDGLLERLLAFETGERRLTDLRHIAQALHAAAVDGQLGVAALAEWLARRIAEAARDTSEERSRRLESDADAVQVVTVHSSKGLEFPVVYVPYAWDRWRNSSPDPLLFHADAGQRVLDVGGAQGPHYGEHRARHLSEEAGEELRLLYVALTRAKCQVVMWWAPSTNTAGSAANRLLLGSFAPGAEPPDTVVVPSDDVVLQRLEQLAAQADGTIAVEIIPDEKPPRWRPREATATSLSAARFSRSVDTAWRRTSYSALTAASHGASPTGGGVGSEPEVPEIEDESIPVSAPSESAPSESASSRSAPSQSAPSQSAPSQSASSESAPPESAPAPDTAGSEEVLRSVASPLTDFPTGTSFGTLVHHVLEVVDTDAPDLEGELLRHCRDAVRSRPGGIDSAALATALAQVLDTPLGPLAGGRSLRDVGARNRLSELDFELPLAGGDEAIADGATVADVASLLRGYLPSTDPLAGYPDVIEAAGLGSAPLRGYLTGSLDAVLRVRDGETPRYLVVDYKTNWLGPWGPTGAEPLTAWHYRPAVLVDAMCQAHYPLQFLLYLVALHRFLRWRQPEYNSDVHLGGVLYLFVRGMSGPATPTVAGTPCGVFSWRPPSGLVPALSQLLGGAS